MAETIRNGKIPATKSSGLIEVTALLTDYSTLQEMRTKVVGKMINHAIEMYNKETPCSIQVSGTAGKIILIYETPAIFIFSYNKTPINYTEYLK